MPKVFDGGKTWAKQMQSARNIDRNDSAQIEPGATKKRQILILCAYPLGSTPDQRFRYEQYLRILRSAGYQIDIEPFIQSPSVLKILYKPRHYFAKIFAVLLGFARRLAIVPKALSSDFIFIHRESAPLGPPWVEALLILFRKRIIFDFDDAIFVSSVSQANRIISWLKCPSKVAWITKHSYKVSVASTYLFLWAKKLNRNVFLIPTSIDPEYHKRPTQKLHSRVRIGWTGTQFTMHLLDIVREPLNRLQEKFDFEFIVISNVDPGFDRLKNYRFIRWSLESEIQDLSQCDIGIMPISTGAFEVGKGAFKAIQYAALSIPAVVSNVGFGVDVVENHRTGLVVNNSSDDWFKALSYLLENRDQISKMGQAAYDRAMKNYSVPALTPHYLKLFDSPPDL